MSRRPYISMADLSSNWREAPSRRPAAAKTLEFRTRAFTKRPAVVLKYYYGPWRPFADYKPGLKCELCKTTIRKACSPQEVDCCRHLFCADCIHQHYNIKHHTTCPTCNKYFDVDDDPRYKDDASSCYGRDDDNDGCPGCGDKWCDGRCDEEPVCPCGYEGCGGDCGALGCGCIDVCRGRCDSEGYLGGW